MPTPADDERTRGDTASVGRGQSSAILIRQHTEKWKAEVQKWKDISRELERKLEREVKKGMGLPREKIGLHKKSKLRESVRKRNMERTYIMPKDALLATHQDEVEKSEKGIGILHHILKDIGYEPSDLRIYGPALCTSIVSQVSDMRAGDERKIRDVVKSKWQLGRLFATN